MGVTPADRRRDMSTLPPLGNTEALIRHAAFRALLEGSPVHRSALADATDLGIDAVDRALASLSQQGRVALDGAGSVVAAAGLSLDRTRHRLRLGSRTFHTWCGIDAIGIPAALGADAVAETSCAQCGRDLGVEIKDGTTVGDPGYVAWDPAVACSNVMEEYCPEANLFCSTEHLQEWRFGRGDPPGRALPLGEVAELGKDWWGDLT